jgi:hypothetical protein
MSQPEWKLVWATDYSALYTDTTGVYPPELAIAQTLDDHDEDNFDSIAAHVYRFPLERCWQVSEHDEKDGTTRVHLVDMNPERAVKTGDPYKDLPYELTTYKPWFGKHLKSVADSVGESVADLTAQLCTDDPNLLARAYESIGGHSGYNNFDSEPRELTEQEFAEWPERGVKRSESECEEFTKGYISCALWCGVMTYKHDEDCPCHEPSENGDAYDSDDCECNPELVSSTDAHEEDCLEEDTLAELKSDAREFYSDNVVEIRASTLDMERAGHDFWLTRNRHGAGYWDEKSRGADADAALDKLTEAAHACGSMGLIEGANMKVDRL